MPKLRLVEAAGAGFPSPAQDWEETGIDLISLLGVDRAATFVFRTSGDSMKEAGIEDGDTLVVDRDVDPRSGSIVIAVCDGGFVVREMSLIDGRPHLIGRNRNSPVRRGRGGLGRGSDDRPKSLQEMTRSVKNDATGIAKTRYGSQSIAGSGRCRKHDAEGGSGSESSESHPSR
jgi:DNA polymerase V